MTEDFLVYRISYEEVVKRLEARYERKQDVNSAAVEFAMKEPILLTHFGNTSIARTRVTMSISKELPYTKITMQLNERKYSGVLFVAVIFASIFLYLVFQLWFIPVLLMFKAAAFWIYIRFRTAQKLESITSKVKKSLID